MNIAICLFLGLAALAWPFIILFNLVISPVSGDHLDVDLAVGPLRILAFIA